MVVTEDKIIIAVGNLDKTSIRYIQDFIAGQTPNFEYLLESEEEYFIKWVSNGMQEHPETYFSGGYYRELAIKLFYSSLRTQNE